MSRAVACRKEKWIARQSFPLEFTAVHVTSLICSCPRFTHFPLLLASKSTPVNMDRLLDPTAHHVRVHLSISCIEIGARPPHALLFFRVAIAACLCCPRTRNGFSVRCRRTEGRSMRKPQGPHSVLGRSIPSACRRV